MTSLRNLLKIRAAVLLAASLSVAGLGQSAVDKGHGAVQAINPPEEDFFTKEIWYDGIPIKAPAVVDDKALFMAKDRLQKLLGKLPAARYNLRMAGAELQIIGKDQVTSDLPDHRALKGKPFDGKLTVDERTRGLGGRHVSCGEENLLELPTDRYHGRDICTHEFSHCLQDYGLTDNVRAMIQDLMKASLAKGHWVGAYAGSNESEFFAEITMWYFGTHGDLHMTGEKPANGPEGLKKYDPEAYAFLDNLYSGRIKVEKLEWKALAPIGADTPSAGPPARRRGFLVRFVNHTGVAAALTRVNGTGDRGASQRAIPAHGVLVVQTPADRIWQIEAGTRTLRFAATAERGIADIR